MRFLPAAVPFAMCGVIPPRIEQNGKTVAPHISQTADKVCKNSHFFGLFGKIFFLRRVSYESRSLGVTCMDRCNSLAGRATYGMPDDHSHGEVSETGSKLSVCAQ